MRLIAFVVAALVVSGPAAAQWRDFAVVNQGFGVAFPSDPQVEEVAMYQIVPGKNVPATVYSVRHNNSLLKVTVADGRDAGLQEEPVVEHAVRQLTQGGQVKVDYPHRIYRIYGRQLSVERPSERTMTQAAVFFANDRLYLVESIRLPGGIDTDTIQFQQSLTFDRNVPNRTAQQMEAIRAACTRGVAGNDRPGNPAGFDDPRCQRD